MNPRSGGGKVVKFDLATEARALGAEVALIDGPGPVDVAALARDAVADGADLLGVAGGDGTQALVAGIAADHNVPFLVIAAGTRNHFAMDLGLDRDHPQSGFEALTDGIEITMDLGVIGGRTFVNNASFGAYAQIVQSSAYRADKRGTTLKMLPDLLSGRRGPRLVARIDDAATIEGPSAILISNNRYELGDPAGLGRRVYLDRGELGVIAITVSSAAQAAALLRRSDSSGLRTFTAHDVVIDADTDEIPVGIDGESVMMPTPVRCEIRPGALRVRLPRERSGLPRPTPSGHLSVLRQLALTTGRATSEDGTQRPGR
jgi:diacylglycerol kinase family enzyme